LRRRWQGTPRGVLISQKYLSKGLAPQSTPYRGLKSAL
jgi:hypothetical protein